MTAIYNVDMAQPSSLGIIHLLQLTRLLLIESVHVRLGKLPGRHLLSEQDVQLLKGSVLGLGQTEVCPGEEEQSGATPDKC